VPKIRSNTLPHLSTSDVPLGLRIFSISAPWLGTLAPLVLSAMSWSPSTCLRGYNSRIVSPLNLESTATLTLHWRAME